MAVICLMKVRSGVWFLQGKAQAGGVVPTEGETTMGFRPTASSDAASPTVRGSAGHRRRPGLRGSAIAAVALATIGLSACITPPPTTPTPTAVVITASSPTVSYGSDIEVTPSY